MRFDLVILGETPDALAAAEDAALTGHRTLLLRQDADQQTVGPEVASVLAAFDDPNPSVSRTVGSPQELCAEALRRHRQSLHRLEQMSGVVNWQGRARFIDRDAVEVTDRQGVREVTADHFLIAVGTTPRRPRGLDFDGQTLFLPEDAVTMTDLPRSLTVLGGNQTARAFARLFAVAGSRVRLIDGQARTTPASNNPVVTGDVLDIRRDHTDMCVRLTDGRSFVSEAILFATRRIGATASLELEAAGLETDEDGRLWCDDEGRTWVPTIFAVGEVVGYPRFFRDDRQAAVRLNVLRRRPSETVTLPVPATP